MNNLITIEKLFKQLVQKGTMIDRVINDETLDTEQQYVNLWEQLEPMEIAQLKLQDIRYLKHYERSKCLIEFSLN